MMPNVEKKKAVGIAEKPMASKVHVKGPLGEMHMEIPPFMKVVRKGLRRMGVTSDAYAGVTLWKAPQGIPASSQPPS